jgi:hypothetical protein
VAYLSNHLFKGVAKRIMDSCRGVLQKDLLNEAKIVMTNQKERGKYYVLVSATNGYQVLFSWSELYNNITSEQVYLLFEEKMGLCSDMYKS